MTTTKIMGNVLAGRVSTHDDLARAGEPEKPLSSGSNTQRKPVDAKAIYRSRAQRIARMREADEARVTDPGDLKRDTKAIYAKRARETVEAASKSELQD